MSHRGAPEGWRVIRLVAAAGTSVREVLEPSPVTGPCLTFDLAVVRLRNALDLRARAFLSVDHGRAWNCVGDEGWLGLGTRSFRLAEVKASLWTAAIELVANGSHAEAEVWVRGLFAAT